MGSEFRVPIQMRIGDGEEFTVGELVLDADEILRSGGVVSPVQVVPALRALIEEIERVPGGVD